MIDYNLLNTQLIIKQDTFNIGNDILNKINSSRDMVDKKDIIINKLRSQLSSYQFNNDLIIKESEVLFPSVSNLSIGNYTIKDKDKKDVIIPIVLYQSTETMDNEKAKRLKDWLKIRLAKDSVEIYRQPLSPISKITKAKQKK